MWSTTSVQPTPAVVSPVPVTSASIQTRHSALHHTDQFGNPVQAFALVENNTMHAGPERDLAAFVPPEISRENIVPLGMDILRAKPYIQQLVEQQVSLLEAKMKNELTQSQEWQV